MIFLKAIKNVIPIIICIPIFFVGGLNFDISLIDASDEIFGLVFPLSLIILFIIIILNILNKTLLLIITFILFHACIIYVMELNYINLNVWLYFIAYIAFDSLYKNYTKEEKLNLIMRCALTLYLIQLAILISNIVFGLSYKILLVDALYVYNYEQYFSISMAIGLAGLAGISKNKYQTLNFSLVAFWGALHSNNSTAATLIFIIIFSRYFFDIKKIEKNLRAIIFLLVPIIPIVIPFIMGLMVNELSISSNEAELILNGRGAIWSDYINLINFENAFNPNHFSRIVESMGIASVHNIFLYYFFTLTPFLGGAIYIFLILNILKIFEIRTRFFILLIVCLAGLNLELITHPFFAIHLALVAALFKLNETNKLLNSTAKRLQPA
jgi:hypothetical protein